MRGCSSSENKWRSITFAHSHFHVSFCHDYLRDPRVALAVHAEVCLGYFRKLGNRISWYWNNEAPTEGWDHVRLPWRPNRQLSLFLSLYLWHPRGIIVRAIPKSLDPVLIPFTLKYPGTGTPCM